MYNNSHRAFLQAFLARSVMTVDEIKPTLAAVMSAQNPERPMLEGDITTPDISSIIQSINVRLAPLDYEIRSTRSQINRELIYALVNTTSDALTQLATTFSPDEIAYIKSLLDCMFETNNTRSREIMAVRGMQASQLGRVNARPRQSQVLQSQTDAEDGETSQVQVRTKDITGPESGALLGTLVEQQFFTKTVVGQKEYYTLAPRALLELRAYLKETYNEPADPDDPDSVEVVRIRDCEACREIVTVGQRCSNRDCGCRFHDHCTAQFFTGRGVEERRCPICKNAWTGDFFVGIRADMVGQKRKMGGRSFGEFMRDGENDE
ncbi:hypothetical protein CC78DRAFT_455871 [Lojkania enalia]|uniref:Non-structural maintenance of chromosomes element 1 homolog n=1 Tax=Lojkania enalia TaxID=147567 RepID=A0A9P4KJA7_9PLEO|nr:hypothetical protein CC78DRAFT_455871 [Didymosphaeria enalia]